MRDMGRGEEIRERGMCRRGDPNLMQRTEKVGVNEGRGMEEKEQKRWG